MKAINEYLHVSKYRADAARAYTLFWIKHSKTQDDLMARLTEDMNELGKEHAFLVGFYLGRETEKAALCVAIQEASVYAVGFIEELKEDDKREDIPKDP